MAYLVSYDITYIIEESSITDEGLLKFAKELYKKGFIKANIEYDEETDTNRIKYSITATKAETDNWKPESTKHKQVEENPSSGKDKTNFLKRFFNSEKKVN